MTVVAAVDSYSPPTNEQLAQAKGDAIRLWNGYLSDGTVLYRVSDAGAREMEREREQAIVEREREQAIVDSFTARLEGENAILETLL